MNRYLFGVIVICALIALVMTLTSCGECGEKSDTGVIKESQLEIPAELDWNDKTVILDGNCGDVFYLHDAKREVGIWVLWSTCNGQGGIQYFQILNIVDFKQP